MKRFLWIALCMLLVGVSSNAQTISNEKYERHWESGHEKVRIISYNTLMVLIGEKIRIARNVL